MKMNKYNTSAATVPSFRIGCIISQLKANSMNASNPAISNIILEVVHKLSSNMMGVEGEGAYTQKYNFFCDRALEIMESSRMFLSQLMEVMKKNSYDYDLMKYTVKVLDQKDYILGNDDLEEPTE